MNKYIAVRVVHVRMRECAHASVCVCVCVLPATGVRGQGEVERVSTLGFIRSTSLNPRPVVAMVSQDAIVNTTHAVHHRQRHVGPLLRTTYSTGRMLRELVRDLAHPLCMPLLPQPRIQGHVLFENGSHLFAHAMPTVQRLNLGC